MGHVKRKVPLSICTSGHLLPIEIYIMVSNDSVCGQLKPRSNCVEMILLVDSQGPDQPVYPFSLDTQADLGIRCHICLKICFCMAWPI